MFEAIASFINSLLAALAGIARLGNAASNPLGALLGTQNAEQTDTSEIGNKTLPTESKAPQATPQTAGPSKRKAITIPENISARFWDKGSPAWSRQPCPGKPNEYGCHTGTDFSAPNGSAVYAPWSGTVIKIGHYDDDGRRGDYIMMTLADGTEYYSGHLANPRVKTGDTVTAGQQIAEIGFYNHTHIQLRVGGVLTDLEEYQKAH